MGGSNSSSSGEEDGDADWKAAIDSVVTGFDRGPQTLASKSEIFSSDEEQEKPEDSNRLKLYQIKAQKLVENLLDSTLEIVKKPISPLNDECFENVGIQLFRQAPHGITFEPIERYSRPKRRPQILPIEEIEENTKEFKKRVRSVVVNGNDIISAAKIAKERSVARFKAKDAAAKEAAKKEEERVTELKRLRGEKWLPSLAI